MKLASLCCVFALCVALSACDSDKNEDPSPPSSEAATSEAPVKAPANEAPAEPPAAKACATGASRCEGVYAGKVREGNNPPLGANVMHCQGGQWLLKRACDPAKNEGCYMGDDPATGEDLAACGQAMSTGE